MCSKNIFKRVVVCAAVKYSDGTLLVGPRHFDGVMQAQYHALKIKFGEAQATAGFLDQEGTFLTRQEAYVVAVGSGQTPPREGTIKHRLFSEDIY